MSLLKVSEITDLTGNGSTYAPGHVVQVQSITKTDAASIGGGTSLTDIPGLSVSITPTSSTSKILVIAQVGMGCSGDQMGHVHIVRNSTSIYPFSYTKYTDVNAMEHASGVHLDSPATTSAITYKLQWANYTINTTYLNRRGADATVRTYSSITVMEIAQ